MHLVLREANYLRCRAVEPPGLSSAAAPARKLISASPECKMPPDLQVGNRYLNGFPHRSKPGALAIR